MTFSLTCCPKLYFLTLYFCHFPIVSLFTSFYSLGFPSHCVLSVFPLVSFPLFSFPFVQWLPFPVTAFLLFLLFLAVFPLTVSLLSGIGILSSLASRRCTMIPNSQELRRNYRATRSFVCLSAHSTCSALLVLLARSTVLIFLLASSWESEW